MRTFEVATIKYCMSRHVRLGLASRANAMIPAAIGADADVPEWWRVHLECRSDVTIAMSKALPL